MFEKTPRILFYALNGVGLGHVNRTVLIARDLRHILDGLGVSSSIVFVTEADDTFLIREAHFPTYNLPLHSGPTAINHTLKGGTVSASFNKPIVEKILSQFKPHITVFDFYFESDLLIEAKKIGSKLVLVLRNQPENILSKRLKPTGPINLFDKIIVPRDADEFPRGTIPQEILSKFVFTEPIVRRVATRNRRHDEIVQRYSLNSGNRIVTATAGAGGFPGTEDYFRNVIQAFEALAERMPDFQGLVFTGPSLKYAIQTSCPNIKIYRYEPHLPNVMAASSLVIAQGGYNTINEIIISNSPAIVIPGRRESDDQYSRARALAADNCIKLLECPTAELLEEEIYGLLNNDNQRDVLKNNLKKKKYVPGNRKAAKAILDLMEHAGSQSFQVARTLALPIAKWPGNRAPDEVIGNWKKIGKDLRQEQISDTIPLLKINLNNASSLKEIISFLIWFKYRYLCLEMSAGQSKLIIDSLRWYSKQKLPIKLLLKEPDKPIRHVISMSEEDPGVSVKIESANWRLVKRCNAACSFCNHWRDKNWKDQEYHLSKIIDVYDQLKDLGVTKVVLNGGEPLLHPYFAFAARYGKSLNMKITANTNATLLRDEKRAREVVNSGLDGVLISLLSHESQIHDRMKCRPGMWDQTIAGIKMLRKISRKIDIGVNIVLTKDNYLSALEIAKKATELGVNSVHFSQVDDLRDVSNSHIRLDKAMQETFYFEILPQIIQYCLKNKIATKASPLPLQLLGCGTKKLGIDVEYSNKIIEQLMMRDSEIKEELDLYAKGQYGTAYYSKHKCFVPARTTYIMANGDIYPCVRSIGYENSNEIMGNVYKGNLRDAIISAQYRNFVDCAGKHLACQTCKNLHGYNLYNERKEY